MLLWEEQSTYTREWPFYLYTQQQERGIIQKKQTDFRLSAIDFKVEDKSDPSSIRNYQWTIRNLVSPHLPPIQLHRWQLTIQRKGI
jgi:hypothetical protein